MAGYVETEVAAYRKTVADAVAGKGLRDGIRQLQEKSKIGRSLKALPARGAIVAKRQIGLRTANTGADYNEISRAYHSTLRELRSSDGLFVLEWYAVSRTTMDRGVFTWLDTG